MTGMEQFIQLFGKVPVSEIVKLILAVVFIVIVYKKIKKYLINRYETEKASAEKINLALEQTKGFLEFKQNNADTLEHFQEEIDDLKDSQEHITHGLDTLQQTLDRRERNKIKDRLLQSYKYYTDINTNPTQSWTQMEADAFWDLFQDYEEAGGDGCMHTTVQPAMLMLKIIN